MQFFAVLDLRDLSFLTPVVPVYKISRLMKMDWLLKNILLPADYKDGSINLLAHQAGLGYLIDRRRFWGFSSRVFFGVVR